jgi:hypothetical protein
MGRAKEVKAGSRRTRRRSQWSDVRSFQGESSPAVVSDVAQRQRLAPSHVVGRSVGKVIPNLVKRSEGQAKG